MILNPATKVAAKGTITLKQTRTYPSRTNMTGKMI